VRILLVEDDRKVGAFLEEGLARRDFMVDWAHDGDEAIELAQAWAYDLVLLDYMLPQKDGIQVAADIRRLMWHFRHWPEHDGHRPVDDHSLTSRRSPFQP
jgi:DNA-binding response OmpR family regulator